MIGNRGRDLDKPMLVNLRPLPDDFAGRPRLTVCVNKRPENGISVSCGPRGGNEIATALEAEIARRGLDIGLATIKCLGLCNKGPNIRLAPGNSWFHGVHASDAEAVLDHVEAHLRKAAAENGEDAG